MIEKIRQQLLVKIEKLEQSIDIDIYTCFNKLNELFSF